jgi:hypothetical protein
VGAEVVLGGTYAALILIVLAGVRRARLEERERPLWVEIGLRAVALWVIWTIGVFIIGSILAPPQYPS